MKGQLVCPVCEQDYVRAARIIPLAHLVMLCLECDSLWEMDVPIQFETRLDFADYMKARGLQSHWELIEVLPADPSA
jgi:hypothetical protein